MKDNIVFLGTGTSHGVPMIGCTCKVCTSHNEKDKRLRSSALITINSLNILIDIGPDFRMQMLKSKIKNINAVLITHEHRDHTAGLDDLRPIYYLQKKPIDIYLESRVKKSMEDNFKYLFSDNTYLGMPKINLNTILNTDFLISDIRITPIRVMHNKLPILGYRIGDICYITDCNYITPKEKNKLYGVKILIINSLQQDSHVSHYNLEESLSLIAEIKPTRAYLTHISHNMGMHSLVNEKLPSNVFLAYDNLEVSF
tara:strand:- start:139 stop:906 length:768 start_codon:yes stop_codon:yes gene_type:complete